MEPITIVTIILFILSGIGVLGYVLSISHREVFGTIAFFGLGFALLFLFISKAMPFALEHSEEQNRQATADSYNIQAYYEVESMRRIEEEDWFLFFHIGENEYIEAVIIKDNKKETVKFNTDSFFDRIRIDQREDNTVGVDVKGEYHLYITQEDYDRILGYQ